MFPYNKLLFIMKKIKEYTYHMCLIFDQPVFEYCNLCKYCPNCYDIDFNGNKIYKHHNPVFDNMIDEDDEDKPEKCYVCKKEDCIPDSSFCSMKCKIINYKYQVKISKYCQYMYNDTIKCHRQLKNKYGCCINHHWLYQLQLSNGVYGCVRFECPCPTTMDGEIGEFCCKECRYKKCEKAYHK